VKGGKLTLRVGNIAVETQRMAPMVRIGLGTAGGGSVCRRTQEQDTMSWFQVGVDNADLDR